MPSVSSVADLDFLQLSFLAIIQGFTEFLPISSSGHLILPSQLLGWPDQGLAFDVAVHAGSLVAVVIYFRRDIQSLFLALLQSLIRRENSGDSKLAWLLLVATVPAGAAGFLLQDIIEQYSRSMLLIGTSSIVFALLLLVSDKIGIRQLDLSSLGWRGALFIGFSQALALIPGTSRSGVTMTAALLCGLSREAATRFSFLLAIPIIAASGLLKGLELLSTSVTAKELLAIGYGTVLSGLVALACIHYFLKLIGAMGFLPFVVYRVVLGCFLIALAMS